MSRSTENRTMEALEVEARVFPLAIRREELAVRGVGKIIAKGKNQGPVVQN